MNLFMKGKEKMENKTNKPLIIEMEEAKAELSQCINHILNDRGIPCYWLEPVLGGIYTQVKMNAKKELEMAQEYVKQQVKEGD